MTGTGRNKNNEKELEQNKNNEQEQGQNKNT